MAVGDVGEGVGDAERLKNDEAAGGTGNKAAQHGQLQIAAQVRGAGNGEFSEVTSASNCTDYQLRRLDVCYKVKGEKGTHLVHTLNRPAIAVRRALIANPGKLPASGRLDLHPRGAAALDRQRADRGSRITWIYR